MLIASLLGEKWREIYETAKMENYRFLSYGDSSILFKNSYYDENSS
jgi:S-adenosylmethionine:tRNA ribosyltransferase-isomerase